MKMMKRIFIGLAVAALVSVLAACSTTALGYEHAAFPADGSTYQVLGRVTVQFKEGQAAYYKLVEAAQAQYPDADDVVNIMVDIRNESKYILSGIAIHYKGKPVQQAAEPEATAVNDPK